jgi:hypothetical protein
MEAERMHLQILNEQQRVVELELEQARYEASGMSHADDRLTALKGTGFSPYIKPAKSRGL